ncbi:hypothetical protein BDZ89DRAFT_1111710 [Hymenopellis radicata]|nr:hypothetical protein BDZ89DRAFT_1111710 [Hymenopellis radicata]
MELSDAEDDEYDEAKEALLKRADELERAAKLLREQVALGSGSKIWVKSIHRQNIGKDASALVQDVQKFTVSGRRRETTWAKKADRNSARYTANTMGYQVPLREAPTPSLTAESTVQSGGDGSMKDQGEGRSAADAIEID